MRHILRRAAGLASVLVGLSATAWAQPVIPVLHLKFDNPNNLGADSSGNNKHGNSNGVIHRANGVAGGAAAFTGESMINLGGVSDALAGDFTISMWLESSIEDEEEIGVFGASDGLEGPKVALTGKRAGFGIGEEVSALHSQSEVSTGKFVHVVVSRNAKTGEESIWVNGVLEGTRQGNGNSLNVHNLLALGGGGNGRAFAGAIDDFQVYNRAFNASAVAFLHANPGSAVGALAVPEPSTYALMGMGLVLLGWTVRRRRS